MPHNELFHSPEVDDLMERIPPRIVRWGITVIFLIFAGILTGSFFISAPQTLSGTLVMTASPSPGNIIAPDNGLIDTVFCQDYTIVQAGDPIAWIRNETDYKSILTLECLVRESFASDSEDAVRIGRKESSLRLDIELQTRYDIFASACEALCEYRNATSLGSDLHGEHLSHLRTAVHEAGISLSTCIRDRIKTYLLTAPVSGEVIRIASHQVGAGDVVASIIPLSQTPIALYGEMVVSGPSYRKIRIGQPVRLDRNVFPDLPGNALAGTVAVLSPLPAAEGCRVRVVFPDKLLRSRMFRYSQFVSVPASILVDEHRLIDRLIPFGH